MNIIEEGEIVLDNKSKVKYIVVDNAEDAPSNYYCMNALQQYMFFMTKTRVKAREACDKMYGKNHYALRVCDLANKAAKKVTAKG